MKKAAAFALALLLVLAGLFWPKVMHVLGWDGQTSDYYAAWSSSVPALITLGGMSTLIAGVWHGFNCHEDGCWRWGRHKVKGTPWCNRHQATARPELHEAELLQLLVEEVRGLREELSGGKAEP